MQILHLKESLNAFTQNSDWHENFRLDGNIAKDFFEMMTLIPLAVSIC